MRVLCLQAEAWLVSLRSLSVLSEETETTVTTLVSETEEIQREVESDRSMKKEIEKVIHRLSPLLSPVS